MKISFFVLVLASFSLGLSNAETAFLHGWTSLTHTEIISDAFFSSAYTAKLPTSENQNNNSLYKYKHSKPQFQRTFENLLLDMVQTNTTSIFMVGDSTMQFAGISNFLSNDNVSWSITAAYRDGLAWRNGPEGMANAITMQIKSRNEKFMIFSPGFAQGTVFKLETHKNVIDDCLNSNLVKHHGAPQILVFNIGLHWRNQSQYNKSLDELSSYMNELGTRGHTVIWREASAHHFFTDTGEFHSHNLSDLCNTGLTISAFKKQNWRNRIAHEKLHPYLWPRGNITGIVHWFWATATRPDMIVSNPGDCTHCSFNEIFRSSGFLVLDWWYKNIPRVIKRCFGLAIIVMG